MEVTVSEKKYEVSLREAVELLGKKSATVRSYVRSGRLTKEYIDGFNGQEMRLNKEEIELLKQSLKDTSGQSYDRVNNKVSKKGVDDGMLTSINHPIALDGNVSRAIELLEKQLNDLRQEKESLRTESKELTDKNFQMAGQLGYFQNQVETLKDQVKQLSAPAESHGGKKSQKSGGFFGWLGIGK